MTTYDKTDALARTTLRTESPIVLWEERFGPNPSRVVLVQYDQSGYMYGEVRSVNAMGEAVWSLAGDGDKERIVRHVAGDSLRAIARAEIEKRSLVNGSPGDHP